MVSRLDRYWVDYSMEEFGPLFQAPWYLARNPDVAAAGAEPLAHYIQYGAAEGRNPNPIFDTRWYLSQNPDVAATGINPLAHYLASGAAEGRDPHPLFDTDWYLSQNPEVSGAGVNPLAHFLASGAREGRAPHPSFDLDWSRPDRAELQIILPDPARVSRRETRLVSVIVPVFNKAPYLWDCLTSILTQSLDDIEIICVDDSSTDGSLAILAEAARLDPRVLVVRNVVNSGAALSRNAGIHLARGRFVQFTDADDILPNDALQTLYNMAIVDEAPLVRGSLNWFRSDPSSGGLDTFNEYHRDHSMQVADRSSVRIEDDQTLWIPWWHTTYLIDQSFLQKVRACYANLSDGEDPVFIASLLAKADRMSTTSKITYLARAYEAPRRTALKHAIDFVRHAAMVRRIYLDHRPPYWRNGYRPFLLSRSDEWFLRPYALSEVEQNIIRGAMMRASIGAYLPFAARFPRCEMPVNSPQAGRREDTLAQRNANTRAREEALARKEGEIADLKHTLAEAQEHNSKLSRHINGLERDLEDSRRAAGALIQRRDEEFVCELAALKRSEFNGRLPRELNASRWLSARRWRKRQRLASDYRLVAASPLFDSHWYLANNPDVALKQEDPVLHYLLHGGDEGRAPSPSFDGSAYLKANPDVVGLRTNPLVHYIRHGRSENRRLRGPETEGQPSYGTGCQRYPD